MGSYPLLSLLPPYTARRGLTRPMIIVAANLCIGTHITVKTIWGIGGTFGLLGHRVYQDVFIIRVIRTIKFL